MAKKRSIFEIDFALDEGAQDEGFPAGNPPARAPETKSFNVQGHPLQNTEPRRGPMASAINESSQANAERASAEAAIRAENDALAHEHVRLKKLGLITDLVETARVHTTKLTRDRSSNVDPELTELKASILAVGLANPIRVEQTEDGYELIQGFRRLNAFRELATETGDARYNRIPAALVPRGEPMVDLYRKMVDENLVRTDLSFGEMAQLALSYAKDAQIEASEAVTVLYASALKQKRTYIRHFAVMMEAFGPALRYPELVPRALGLELYRAFEADPELASKMVEKLKEIPDRDGPQETACLRACLADARKKVKPDVARSVSKTSLRLRRPEGMARITALDGKVELRLERDFSAVSKAQLLRGIEAFLAELDVSDP